MQVIAVLKRHIANLCAIVSPGYSKCSEKRQIGCLGDQYILVYLDFDSSFPIYIIKKGLIYKLIYLLLYMYSIK